MAELGKRVRKQTEHHDFISDDEAGDNDAEHAPQGVRQPVKVQRINQRELEQAFADICRLKLNRAITSSNADEAHVESVLTSFRFWQDTRDGGKFKSRREVLKAEKVKELSQFASLADHSNRKKKKGPTAGKQQQKTTTKKKKKKKKKKRNAACEEEEEGREGEGVLVMTKRRTKRRNERQLMMLNVFCVLLCFTKSLLDYLVKMQRRVFKKK